MGVWMCVFVGVGVGVGGSKGSGRRGNTRELIAIGVRAFESSTHDWPFRDG